MSRDNLLTQPEAEKPRFFYGYIIVAAAMVIDAVLAGVHFTFGIFFEPVSTQFQWSRAATSGAFTLYSVLNGLLFIVAGRISDRVGPRPVLMFCGVIFGLSYILMSTINHLWHLYFYYGILFSIGMSGGFVPLMSTIARWFVKRRGLMTGLVLAGGGVGQAVLPPVTTWLISAFTWRTAYIIVGAVSLVLLVSLSLFLRRDPARMKQRPYGEVPEATGEGKVQSVRSFTFKEAVKTKNFWLYFWSVVLVQVGLGAMVVHATPHGLDLGLSPSAAAAIVTTFAGVGIAARVTSGGIVDRIGGTRVMATAALILGITLIAFSLTRSTVLIYLIAGVFGVGFGGYVSSMSPLAAQLFGLTSHGVIFGVAMFGVTVGAGIGSLAAGAVFDARGTYSPAFLSAGVLSLVTFVLVLFIRTPKVTTARTGIVSVK